uniref:(California timema) hypothetical protein n=1 Tax=Timema californicum TaxID=61474 RepID=A0A7R9P8K4_TIMCA|nr:unnamed protein product [Timema californicum]
MNSILVYITFILPLLVCVRSEEFVFNYYIERFMPLVEEFSAANELYYEQMLSVLEWAGKHGSINDEAEATHYLTVLLPALKQLGPKLVLEELELLYNVTYFSVRFIRSLFDTLNFEKVISDPAYKLFLAIRLSDSPENYLALKSFDFSGYNSRRDLLFGIIAHLTSSELVPLQNRVLFQTARKYAFLDNLYINTSFIDALSRYEAFRNQRDRFDENDPNYERLKNLMMFHYGSLYHYGGKTFVDSGYRYIGEFLKAFFENLLNAQELSDEYKYLYF